MKNLSQKLTSSTRTPAAGPDVDPSSANIPDFDFQVDLTGSMHSVMMSDELVDVIDTDDLYGQAPTDQASEDTSGDTRQPERPMGFRCGVTLADEEERSGDVLSFLRGGVQREVQFLCTMRVADDISTSSVHRVRVEAPSGVEVFDVCFAPDEDEYDAPSLSFQLSQLGPILTLSFSVDLNSYSEEEDRDE